MSKNRWKVSKRKSPYIYTNIILSNVLRLEFELL